MLTTKAQFRSDFLACMNTPTSLPPEEKFAALHGYDLNCLEENQGPSPFLDSQSALGVKIYLIAEEKIRELLPDRTDFISDLEIIHNKGLFDCLNEALDYYRPFGLGGAPYPWKANPSCIPRKVEDADVDDILERSKEKVLVWASFRAGYLGSGLLVEGESAEKKEEIIKQIKEERLSKALAFEIYEKESDWLNYEDQRTELEIEISDLLFERLTLETAELLYTLKQNRKFAS